MQQNYITLPRSKLYELVWTKPVTELARELGISDVALAKRCRAIKIPLPPRGYWARVAAGQKLRRPPLPPFRTERSGPAPRPRSGAPPTRVSDAMAPSSRLPAYVTTRDADGGASEEPAVKFDTDRTTPGTASADDELPALKLVPTTDIVSATDLVKRTARHQKHPRRAELQFTQGAAHGPIIRLHVSPEALDRALLFADLFVRAAAEQGWKTVPAREPERSSGYSRTPEPRQAGPQFADMSVDGHKIEFQLEERYELRELPPTAADLAKQKRNSWFRPERRTETVWSGRLRLKRPRLTYPYCIDGKSWFETRHRTLDTLIPSVLADFRTIATRMQEVDEKVELERIERERKEKLRAELAARREANQGLIHALEAQAGAWHRAQYLRRYLRAARRTLGPGAISVDLNGQPTDFIAWAEHYVNQLDPLHPEARDPGMAHVVTSYYRADEERVRQELQRLSGFAWPSTSKHRDSPSAADDDDSDDDEEFEDYWDEY